MSTTNQIPKFTDTSGTIGDSSVLETTNATEFSKNVYPKPPSTRDSSTDGQRAPIVSIARPPQAGTAAGAAPSGFAKNLWIGIYPSGSENPGQDTTLPATGDLVSIYQYVTTQNDPNGSTYYHYGVWAWNPNLVRFPNDKGNLYGAELDFVNQRDWGAGGAAFPGTSDANGQGHVTGVACVMTNPAYDGSAAFFCTVAAQDSGGLAARWRYGIVLAGVKDYAVYVGGRSRNPTGEDTNGDGETGMNVNPDCVLFTDTNATNLIKSTGSHTYVIDTTCFSVTETILALKDRDNGSNSYGQRLTVGRNTNGNCAPGSVDFRLKGGNEAFVWADNNGDLRIRGNSTTSGTPPHSGEADTLGTVVGTQTSCLDAKNIVGEFDEQAALAEIERTPIYRFNYKDRYAGEEFVGVITDFSPVFGMDRDAAHPGGKSLNEVTLHGYEVAAIKALSREIAALKARLDTLERAI